MKKRFKIILLVIFVMLVALSLFACNSSNNDIIDTDDTPIKKPVYSVDSAVDDAYLGINNAKDVLDEATVYSVNTRYMLYTDIINYEVTYRANYKENAQDSEIYVNIFDNATNANRLTLYYDSKDLYLSSGASNKYIKEFSYTSMFNNFYDLVKYFDITSVVFDEKVASLFNKNGTISLVSFINKDNVSKINVSEKRDSIEFNEVNMTLLVDTINNTLIRAHEGVGDKFDILTDKYLGFKLGKVLERAFETINLEELNLQRESNVVDNVILELNGRLKGNEKYIINADISYKIDEAIDVLQGENIKEVEYTTINLGKNLYKGTIVIPKLSEEPFDINISTLFDTNNNENNEIMINMSDALDNNLLSAYYRDQIAYLDISGMEDNYIKSGGSGQGAIDISAFNLPKVYFEGISITNLINTIYNSGTRMIMEILNNVGDLPSSDNENLYDIVMNNFGYEGDVVYYDITEDLITKLRQNDEGVADILARTLNINVKLIDSMLGEDFFENSTLRICYNTETNEIGLKYYHNEELEADMEVLRMPFKDIKFPDEIRQDSYIYKEFKMPLDAKTEFIADIAVGSGKVTTDFSAFFGTFIGDESGKNTPYLLGRNDRIHIEGEISESFLSVSNGDMNSEYKLRMEFSSIISNVQSPILNIYTNPVNNAKMIVEYMMPLGKNKTTIAGGYKYQIDRSIVSIALNKIVGQSNDFNNEQGLVDMLKKIIKEDSNNVQVINTDGFYNFVLQSTPKNGVYTDPLYDLIGISGLSATTKVRFLFSAVLLNDISVGNYNIPELDDEFKDAVQIESLYESNSNWKDSITVNIGTNEIELTPNYIASSILVADDKKQYNPQCSIFGVNSDYLLSITSEIGSYELKNLINDTIIVDPAFSRKVPTEIEVLFMNGKTGYLPCVIEGLTDDTISYAGLNREVFANEKVITYTLRIGNNSILEKEFQVYFAVQNRTLITYKADDDGDGTIDEIYDTVGTPCVGMIVIDPYTYAMKKANINNYNPITEAISEQEMKIYFDNLYALDENNTPLTYNVEGYNYFILSKLNLNWQFDESKISFGGAQQYAYAYYGDIKYDISGKFIGDGIKIAIKVIVKAKNIDHINIGTEENGRYVIDSLIKSSYVIPTQCTTDIVVKVTFTDGTSRKIKQTKPIEISDNTFYNEYIATTLNWNLIDNYMNNVNLEEGSRALFGKSQGNNTWAIINFGTLGGNRVNLTVEVPERKILLNSEDNNSTAVAVGNVTDNGDGTVTYSTPQSYVLSPVKFSINGDKYEAFDVNPYETQSYLPSSIFLEVKHYNSSATKIFIEYPIVWQTTNNNDIETNIIKINENGKYNLAHPNTEETYFYVFGKIGDGNFYETIRVRIHNLDSQLQSITYEGMNAGSTEITIDPYKAYSLPGSFVAVLESGELVSRENISWEVSKGNEESYLPINVSTSLPYDTTMYDKNGNYIFDRNGGTYVIRYILQATNSVLKQALIINVNVPARTIVEDKINVFETGNLVNGYFEINCLDSDSLTLYNRLKVFLDDTTKGYTIGVGFDEARTNMIIDRYNLYVEWNKSIEGTDGYEHSLVRLINLLKNPEPGITLILEGIICKGTINEQNLSIEFNFSSLDLSYITIPLAYTCENSNAIELPQKGSDGRISIAQILSDNAFYINIDRAFALTTPKVDSVSGNIMESYADPMSYLQYIFNNGIAITYTSGVHNEYIPQIDNGIYLTFENINKNIFGINDNLGVENTSLTILNMLKLSNVGSAVFNIPIIITAEVDERISINRNLTAEIFDEDGESCGINGYILPKYVEISYKKSGKIRYYIDSEGWFIGDNYKPMFNNLDKTTNINVDLINVLSNNPVNYAFYMKLPLQPLKGGIEDDKYYYLNVNIPRKNIQEINYNAEANEFVYNINEGFITVDNAYMFYSATAQYTDGNNNIYKTGFDYTKLPTNILAEIKTGKFEATDINSFVVSWEPIENAIRKEDFNSGISRDANRLLATAKINSYYDEYKIHVYQEVKVYVEMEALSFIGIDYSVDGNKLPTIKNGNDIENIIVIDPYNDEMGYEGDFVLPKVNMAINFANNERYVIASESDIESYALLNQDKTTVLLGNITHIPYSYAGHSLIETYTDLSSDGVNIRLTLYSGQVFDLFVRILNRAIDKVQLNNVVLNSGNLVDHLLTSLYYVDPYNSRTQLLPTNVEINFHNEDDIVNLPVVRWDIYNSNNELIDINEHSYFYTKDSTLNEGCKYAYFKNTKESCVGGIYKLVGYISMGKNDLGVDVGIQPFDVNLVVLNRSLQIDYVTSYKYSDPVAGLLSDIGCSLDSNMFVDSSKYYAQALKNLGYSSSDFYSNINSDEIVQTISWDRYNSDSIISYEGFSDKEITGYIYYQNTNIGYLYSMFKKEVDLSYSDLIKSMTYDKFFMKSGDNYIPKSNYSTNTKNSLTSIQAKVSKLVNAQSFDSLLSKYYVVNRVNANYFENTLLRTVINEHPEFDNEQNVNNTEFKSYLYNQMKTDYANDELSQGDKEIYENWLIERNKFIGNYDGFSENVDIDNISAYQIIKKEMYDYCSDNNVFTLEEINVNNSYYVEIQNNLSNFINSAIWYKVFDRVNVNEASRMTELLGTKEGAVARSSALKIFINENLACLGSYGEETKATISAPKVTFDMLVSSDEFREELDTFYFNIYNSDSLIDNVDAKFIENKEEMYDSLINEGLAKIKQDFEISEISNTLQTYYNFVFSQIMNSFVPTDSSGDRIPFTYEASQWIYDYDTDGNISEVNKRDAVITAYRNYLREQAIIHFTADETFEYMVEWPQIRGAYVIQGKTELVNKMDSILLSNSNDYTLATEEFKIYLQDIASSYFDEKIAIADKQIDALLIKIFMEDTGLYPKEQSQVFQDVYGGLVGINGVAGTLYGLTLETLQNVYPDQVATLVDKKNSSTAANKYLDAIYYFMYDSGASVKIRTVVTDIFNMKVGLDSAYYEVLDRIDEFNGVETVQMVNDYYNNIDIEKADYASSLTDEEFETLKKAKVFYNMYLCHKSDISNAKELLVEIYDNALLEIKSDGYANYISNMDTSDVERVNEVRDNYNEKAMAFDLIFEEKTFEANAAQVQLQSEINNYLNNNLYRYSEEIYNSVLNDGFVFDDNGNITNYLSLSEEENEQIGMQAVEFYYNNVASDAEKAKIVGASASYGECIVAGNFVGLRGVYDHLIQRCDLGEDFINNLSSIYYDKKLSKAQNDIAIALEEDLKNPDNSGDHSNLHSIDTYMTIYNRYYDKFKLMIKNWSTVVPDYLVTMADSYAYEEYKEDRYNELTNSYSQKVYNLEHGDLLTDSHIYQYNQLKQTEDDTFEEILDDSYQNLMETSKKRNYNAYIYIKDQLLSKEMTIINDAEDLIRIREGYVTVFDNLNLNLSFENLDKYGFIAEDSVALSNYWANEIANNPDYQILINDSYISQLSVAFTDVSKMMEIMEYLIKNKNNYLQASEKVDGLIAIYYGYSIKYSNLYNSSNETKKGFLDALYLEAQLGIPQKNMAQLDYYETEMCKLRTYVLYNNLIYDAQNMATEKLDKNLLELDDMLLGKVETFTDKTKQAYDSMFIELLEETNLHIASKYLELEIQKNYSEISFTIQNTESMTELQLAYYNVNKQKYVDFLQKIYDELLLTSKKEFVKSYEGNIATADMLATIKTIYNTQINQEFTDNYLSGIVDTSDSSYQLVFDRMLANSNIYYTFYASDHVSENEANNSLKKKHYLIFDVQSLQEEGSAVTQTINKVELTNYSKRNQANTVFVKDGYRYIYPQIELRYLDFYDITTIDDVASITSGGTPTVNSKFINKITIDPLNPDLPSHVKAYGAYEDKNGISRLVDAGYVNISYDEIFNILTDEFGGNALNGDTGSYAVTAINDKGECFNIGLTVYYLDRTLQKYWVAWGNYAENNNLVGNQDESGLYINYYDLHNSLLGTNKICINPTQESMVDVSSKKYNLPDSFVGNYESYASDEFRKGYSSCMYYYDVVWDLGDIEYSLKGNDATAIRILSYCVANENNTYNRVSFNYESNVTTIAIFSKVDNSKISENTFVGTPTNEIWNIDFEVKDKAVEKLYVISDNGEKKLLGEFLGDNISGVDNSQRWLVALDQFSVNPYYVELFDNLSIEVNGGEEINIPEGVEWTYNSINGEDHLAAIVAGTVIEDNNRYIVVGFNYICETIWLKIMVDDVKLERPQVSDGMGGVTNGFVDGGTIYLISNDVANITKEEQLEKFYSFIYYNFAVTAETTDWRKVPLTFKNETIRDIVLTKGNIYNNVYACIGSDLEYNIEFTIEVISPNLYAKLDDMENKFVKYDKISMPIDSNGRVISSSADMPQIFDNKFVHIANNGDEVDFQIISKKYDVVAQTVVYTCRYFIDDSSSYLAGDEEGSKAMLFEVELPLVYYNYSSIDKVKINENLTAGVSKYTWKYVNMLDEEDALIWQLGEPMSSCLLPRGKLDDGRTFEFLWDLKDVNINKATGSYSYYTIKGYYYSSTAQWLYKEIRVYINKLDISNLVVEEGENRNLEKVYDGNNFNLELEYDKVVVLRENGELEVLPESNYVIEYKLASASVDTYTTTFRPHNKGEYTMRITISDYNCEGQFIMNLKVNAFKILGEEKQGGMGSGTLISDIVFEGANVNNIITYTYNGEYRAISVASGLPMVHVEFWPQTAQEKEILYTQYLSPIHNNDDILLAKSRAYNDLYDRVSSATRVYMDNKKAYIKKTLNIINDTELNAEVFDALEYNLYISEVVPNITYKNLNDEILTELPLNAGDYIVVYSIKAADNNGNYEFDIRTTDVSAKIVINQPVVIYNIQDDELTYNGDYQSPYVSGLNDENGNLPQGVTLTYTYKYVKNMVNCTATKIKNVGNYVMTIEIDGGQNYPDGLLENIPIRIVAKNLYINIDEIKAQGEYLSEIKDYDSFLNFDGLQTTDNKNYFYTPKTSSEVKDYFVLGAYPIYIDGFIASGNSDVSYTKRYSDDKIAGVDGKEYYRFILKSAIEDGNLYQYINEEGNYEFASTIELFTNYNVFVIDHNNYTIYAEEDAIIVNNDSELQTAINNVEVNEKVTIYLNAIKNADGTYGKYSKLYINKNASITLIGCYNENKEIISIINGVEITKGEVVMKILKMEGLENSNNIVIGAKAGLIGIVDCYFDGLNIGNKAILASGTYTGELMVTRTIFKNYIKAIELMGGSAEITYCAYNSNKYGISVYTSENTYIRGCEFISNKEVAVEIDGEKDIILMENNFEKNIVGIKGKASYKDNAFIQNTFKNNATDFEEIIYI
ncbi:MAG: hypothetical protein WCR54_00215 [Clostridia bacterium]